MNCECDIAVAVKVIEHLKPLVTSFEDKLEEIDVKQKVRLSEEQKNLHVVRGLAESTKETVNDQFASVKHQLEKSNAIIQTLNTFFNNVAYTNQKPMMSPNNNFR